MSQNAEPVKQLHRKSMFVFNDSGQFLDFDDHIPQITGYTAKELSRMNIADLLIGEIEREISLFRRQIKGSGQIFQKQAYIKQKDGTIAQLTLEILEMGSNRYIGYCKDYSTSRVLTKMIEIRDKISQLGDNIEDRITSIECLLRELRHIPLIDGVAAYYFDDNQAPLLLCQEGRHSKFFKLISTSANDLIVSLQEPLAHFSEADCLPSGIESYRRESGIHSVTLMSFSKLNKSGFTIIFTSNQEPQFSHCCEIGCNTLFNTIGDYLEHVRHIEHIPLLKSLFDQTDDMVLVSNDSGIIIYRNPVTLRFFESSDNKSRYRYIYDIYESKISKLLKDYFKRREEATIPGIFSASLKLKNQSSVPAITKIVQADHEGRKLYYFIIDKTKGSIDHFFENMTDKLKLRHRQRLESIGTLTSGITHEINNPLTGIINYAQLLHERMEDESLRLFSKGIIDETERIIMIVTNLLAFSKFDHNQNEMCSIVELINTVLILLNSSFKKEKIAIEFDYDKDLPPLICRRYQVEQIFINLLNNARNALNERYENHHPNKKIEIQVNKIDESGRSWLRIYITDYGIGIPQENREHIFKPFFTTNVNETGTGLGLAVSHEIIRDHSGKCSVESELNKFTRFIIDFPV